MKKKIRKLKRFLGVSAILLAVLLANIPFPTQAEGDDTSGNDPSSYELTLSDTRSSLLTTSRISSNAALSENLTVTVTDEDRDISGTLASSNTYTYETVTVKVTDTDTGSLVDTYGSIKLILGVTEAMGEENCKVQAYSATGAQVPESILKINKRYRKADTVELTLTDQSEYSFILQRKKYVSKVTSKVDSNVATVYSPIFTAAKMDTDWDLVVEVSVETTLEDKLAANSGIKYDEKLILDAKLRDVQLGMTEGFLVDDDKFDNCVIRLKPPAKMEIRAGSFEVYTLDGASELEKLPCSVASDTVIQFTTTHFSEFAILYTKTPEQENGSTEGDNNNSGTNTDTQTNTEGNTDTHTDPVKTDDETETDSQTDRDDDHDDRDDKKRETVMAVETEPTVETETEAVVLPPVITDTGEGGENTEITMNAGNTAAAGRKGGAVDMPKTGDADTYRLVGVLMLLFFGMFELISSIPTGKRKMAK